MRRLRPVTRLFALGIGTATCATAVCSRRKLVRFDAFESCVPRTTERRASYPADYNSPHVVEQISRGSIYGLGAGIIVAFFSRTLVFLSALAVGSMQIATSMGLGLPGLISFDGKSVAGLLAFRMWVRKPWFTSSFLLAFVLAALVRL